MDVRRPPEVQQIQALRGSEKSGLRSVDTPSPGSMIRLPRSTDWGYSRRLFRLPKATGRESERSRSAGGWLVLWQPGWWIPERISVFVEQLAEGRSQN